MERGERRPYRSAPETDLVLDMIRRYRGSNIHTRRFERRTPGRLPDEEFQAAQKTAAVVAIRGLSQQGKQDLAPLPNQPSE